MKKFRFGFAFKSTLLVSILLFAIIFGVSLFVMESFYGTIRTYTENMLKVINKGFKQDYFDWAVENINAYGKTIVKNNLDEYNTYMGSIRSSITGFEENYSIETNSNQGKTPIVSPFYWDGEKLFSEDDTLQDTNFINFIRESVKSMKTDDRHIIVSYTFPYPTYVYKLKKGVIGCVLHPERYNRVWLKNVFKGTKVNFYALFIKKDESAIKEVSTTNFKKVISEMETTQIELDTVYRTLSQKIEKEEGFEVVSGTYADRIKFFIHQDYGDFIFKAIIGIPMRGVFYLTTLEVSLLMSVPIVVILIIVMSILNRNVFARIRYLSEKISELGKSGGDLSYRVEARTNISEVREVAENINDFLDAVEGIVKKSKDTFRDVEQNIQVLSELGDEVVKVGEVISRQDEVRQMIEEINAMTGEVGTTVEEMLRSIETIRNNVEKQYAMMEEMSGMVEETIMTVSNVGRRIEKANELLSNLRDEALRSSGSVRKNVEEVRDVNMFLGNVLEVVDVIKGISDRIEVLSMNAGIEAAHAGEAGRGFAVVAEEMGNLAEDSRKKAVEVERIVRDVIERVKGSVEGVEENGERFVRIADGIREVSAFVGEINASMVEVGRTNEMVMGVISNLTSYSEGIKVAVEEGRVGMEEVVRAVYEVSDATSNLSDRFGEVYGVMRGAVEVLRGASERLPLVVESLRVLGEELNKFKVKEVKFTKGITLVE